MTDEIEDRMWAALDAVHDMDVTLTDYAKACAVVARQIIEEERAKDQEQAA